MSPATPRKTRGVRLGRPQVAPTVRGSVAEELFGLLDREQVVLSEVAAYLDLGIELRDQGGVGSGHDGVRIGNDENLGSGQIRLQCQTDRLGAVAGVDVAPQVPLPRTGSSSKDGKRA